MAAEKERTCTVCGAKNDPKNQRCSSCGATLDRFEARELTAEEQHARRYQQDGFDWKWVGVSFVVYALLLGIVLVALPMAIDAFDPQGSQGLIILTALLFVGGAIVARLSPGKTFIEPTVGAVIAVIPALWWLNHIADVFPLSPLALVFGGIIGVMVTLLGGFLGERLQMGRG